MAAKVVTTYKLIRHAIVKKEQVTGTYDGHYREMCPHLIGTKDGRPQALFYQFGGANSSGLGPSGSPENWRCIPISGLSDVESRDGPWHTAPNYSQLQTCVDQIDVEVALNPVP